MHTLPIIRFLAVAALTALAVPLAHAEVYRTVDQNGVVTFTDVALPGAEPVVLDVRLPDPASVARAREEAEWLIERADAQVSERLARQQAAPALVERETIVYREVVTQGAFAQRGFLRPFHGPAQHPPRRRHRDRFSDERPRFAPPGFAEPAFRPPQRVRRGSQAAPAGSAKGL